MPLIMLLSVICQLGTLPFAQADYPLQWLLLVRDYLCRSCVACEGGLYSDQDHLQLLASPHILQLQCMHMESPAAAVTDRPDLTRNIDSAL